VTLPTHVASLATPVAISGAVVLALAHRDADTVTTDSLVGALDPIEFAAVERFRHVADARAAMLRRLLARAAARVVSPETDLAIRTGPCARCGGPHGRPSIVGAELSVSMSGTATMSAVAVSSTPIGIDIEATLSPETSRALADLLTSRSGGPEASAELWTALEARAKLIGAGVADVIRSNLAADALVHSFTLRDGIIGSVASFAPEGSAARIVDI